MKRRRKNKICSFVCAVLVAMGNIGYADQNRQEDKIAFTQQAPDESVLSPYALQQAFSAYQVFAGNVIPAVLISGINSDLPGNIIAQVSQNVYDSITGTYLLIPQGTKILGKYDSRVTYGQNRVLVVWNRLIFPNGKSITLQNLQGVDREGYSGFKDKLNSHYGRVLWSALLGAAATGGVAAATSTGDDDDSFKAEAGAKAAENISNTVQSITDKNLNLQPTIIIRPGYPFNLLVSKDLILEPYEEE